MLLVMPPRFASGGPRFLGWGAASLHSSFRSGGSGLASLGWGSLRSAGVRPRTSSSMAILSQYKKITYLPVCHFETYYRYLTYVRTIHVYHVLVRYHKGTPSTRFFWGKTSKYAGKHPIISHIAICIDFYKVIATSCSYQKRK